MSVVRTNGDPRAWRYRSGVTVYVIVSLNIHDRPTYDRYTQALRPTLAPFHGEVLVADDQPRVLEGTSDINRVVMLAFPDRDSFRGWATSPEYQAIIKDRHDSATSTVLLVNGLPAE